jgi:DNA (cytosine-5)-methyltransferase 1
MRGSNKTDSQKDSESFAGTVTAVSDCMGTHQQTRTSDNVALPERQMRELALFAGAGGGILGGKLLGWRCVCAVEIDAYARDRLLDRQADGCIGRFPVWDDVATFDGRPWRGHVDVVSGGFPCQDISAAGKGAGVRGGQRSGLWTEYARIVGEVQPRFVWVENSPMLTLRGLDVVLGDLSALGYDAVWGVVSAADAGAPHLRERIWILAHAQQQGLEGHGADAGQPAQPEPRHGGTLADACGVGRDAGRRDDGEHDGAEPDAASKHGIKVFNASSKGLSNRPAREIHQPGQVEEPERSDWWATEPDVGRASHGLA